MFGSSREGYYDGKLTVEGQGILQGSVISIIAHSLHVDAHGLISVQHEGLIEGSGKAYGMSGAGHGGRGGLGVLGMYLVQVMGVVEIWVY